MFKFYTLSLKLDCYSNEVKTEICVSSFAHDFWATGCQSNFHLYINSDTHDRAKDQIGGLVYSLQTVSCGTSCADKCDILSTSASFIQDNKKILDESWRDDICMMLNRLIEHTISSAIPTDEKSKYGEVCQQELFLLAAVMKLMGCTLFRIVESMKHIRVMNLLVFEEGNLDMIVSFLQLKSVSLPKLFSGKTKIGITRKQSSRRIVYKFEKIRKMQVKVGTTLPPKCINSAMTNVAAPGNNELQNGGLNFSDEHDETWANGEAFFKSIGEKSDYSDPIVLVACKEKDYSSWLKTERNLEMEGVTNWQLTGRQEQEEFLLNCL